MNKRFPLAVQGAYLLAMVLPWLDGGGAAVAGSGKVVAARHSVSIESASRVVLGNGSLGCLIESAENSSSFFEATLSGEHWLIQEQVADATPIPAVRVPVCRLTLRLNSDRDPQVGGHRLTRNSVYRLMDNRLVTTPLAGAIAAATLTVSPTRDLVIGRMDFRAPCDATLEIDIPRETEDVGSPPRTTQVGPEAVSLTRDLPFGESYGIGAVVWGESGEVLSSTTEAGSILALTEIGSLSFGIQVVHPEEGLSLERRTVEETRALGDADWRSLLEQDREWWEGFWDRSIVDTSGSTDDRAHEFERSWVGFRHAFATHARGTFPPGESGYWPSQVGGRVWHPLLWETFRGWILTGGEADIRWLSYPLSFPQDEVLNESEGAVPPLLPLESGPDGIPASDSGSLVESLASLVGGATSDVEALMGREFSAYPLLVDCLASLESGHDETDELFPFLKANALRAEKRLARAEKNDPAVVASLLTAIEAARRQAERIGVDPRSRTRWRTLLESYGLPISATTSLENSIHGNPLAQLGEKPLETFLELSLTPDGLARDPEGDPSMLLTGIALSRLADGLFSERKGALQVIPDIPLDGSWSLEAQNVSVPGGFTLRTLTMRNGLIDSFLIRSNKGEPCRLKRPSGWSSARVLNVGSPQSPVHVEGTDTLIFETAAGDEFLVAPVW